MNAPVEKLSFDIRQARPDEAEALAEFIDRNYAEFAPWKGLPRWRWLYQHNPFRQEDGDAPTVWIAARPGLIAGQMCTQDAMIWLDGAEQPASWLTDFMLDPAARGQGLGTKVHNAPLAQRQILLSMTISPVTRRIQEKVGCLTLAATHRYQRHHRLSPATVRRFLAHKAHERPDRARWLKPLLVTGIGPLAGALAGRLLSAVKGLRRPRRALDGFRVEEVARFPDSVDAFWESARESWPAIMVRSARWLNWRFVDAPDLTYRRFLLFGADGALRGWLVTRVAQPAELPLGLVVDQFARAGDDAAHDALLALAEQTLGGACEVLEAGASSPPLIAALERAGYVRMHTTFPTLMVADAAVRARIAALADRFHFTRADSDWDQVHPVP